MNEYPITRNKLAYFGAAIFLLSIAPGCGDSVGAPDEVDHEEELIGAVPITAGQVTFVNSCAMPLTLWSSIEGLTLGSLAAKGAPKQKDQISVPITAFNPGGQNVVIPYPNLTVAQCSASYCDEWTALGGLPGTIQRKGFMWQDANLGFAAYCNPSLSGREICAKQNNCCGPKMTQDGTFGTHWEFTPNATNSHDYANLSTNFGSSPTTPPTLCSSPGSNKDDCVEITANIFFNIPIKWSTNSSCSFGTKAQQVTTLACLSVDCTDAYQHPTDDKQCSCSSGGGRGYLVEFCPSGSSMPGLPS